VLEAFAHYIDATNEADAADGAVPRLPGFEDAFAIVGAVGELASRQLRTGARRRSPTSSPSSSG
jgi:hypothetical protein